MRPLEQPEKSVEYGFGCVVKSGLSREVTCWDPLGKRLEHSMYDG